VYKNSLADLQLVCLPHPALSVERSCLYLSLARTLSSVAQLLFDSRQVTSLFELQIQSVSDQCSDCLSSQVAIAIFGLPTGYHSFDTAFGVLLSFYTAKESAAGTSHQHFGEHGLYTVVLQPSSEGKHKVVVEVIVDQQPDDTFRPLWTAGAWLSRAPTLPAYPLPMHARSRRRRAWRHVHRRQRAFARLQRLAGEQAAPRRGRPVLGQPERRAAAVPGRGV
jgi:hypothetical protein